MRFNTLDSITKIKNKLNQFYGTKNKNRMETKAYRLKLFPDIEGINCEITVYQTTNGFTASAYCMFLIESCRGFSVTLNTKNEINQIKTEFENDILSHMLKYTYNSPEMERIRNILVKRLQNKSLFGFDYKRTDYAVCRYCQVIITEKDNECSYCNYLKEKSKTYPLELCGAYGKYILENNINN